jgi:hypothetical protein
VGVPQGDAFMRRFGGHVSVSSEEVVAPPSTFSFQLSSLGLLYVTQIVPVSIATSRSSMPIKQLVHSHGDSSQLDVFTSSGSV